jgi:hypothetical protein
VHSVGKVLDFVLFLFLGVRIGLRLFLIVIFTHDVQCTLHMVVLGAKVGWSGQNELFKISFYILRLQEQAVDGDNSRFGILFYLLNALSITV